MNFFITAMPDLNFTYDDILIVDNKSYVKWTAKGTNTGKFGENAPSGKPGVTHGFSRTTFNEDGSKITQEESFWDNLSYLQAWGYTLTPPGSD